MQTWWIEPVVLFKRLVSVVTDENSFHLQQRNPHDSELHAWPGWQNRRCVRIFRLIHLPVTSITFYSRTDISIPPLHFLFFFFLSFCFFTLKVVSTLTHNLAWNIAQQLFTELQNKLTDWSTHNISHCPMFILVVLFRNKPTTKCKHEKNKSNKQKKQFCINVNRFVPPPCHWTLSANCTITLTSVFFFF